MRNVIERGIILSDSGIITPRALPRELVEQTKESPATDSSPLSLAEVEKRHIHRVQEHFEGNRSQAAESLGIGRKTLYRKMKEYGLEGL